MKFFIEESSEIGLQHLVYLFDEYSFFTDKINDKIDFELAVNKITLSVLNNRVIDLGGFCGFAEWNKSGCQVPMYKKGILRVERNLKYGFVYGINDKEEYDYPTYVNTQTGWVCIGDPEKKGNAVEFITNCVAVIDDDMEFVSLWLKPEQLPDL